MLSEKVRKKFISSFGRNPLVVRSPGRVNLIGEHTDYNGGYVLPAAIDKEIVCALAPNYGRKCTAIALDLNEEFQFNPTEPLHSALGWPNYLMGVVEQFLLLGRPIPAFDCVFAGNIPVGAGLSSSAALECALAYALNLSFDLGLNKMELVKLGQKAENEFVGVKCGIMDQFASVFGKAGQVIRLDCRDLSHAYFDFPMKEYRLLLCDTGVKHALASSEYNTRRMECEQGVAYLRQFQQDILSLRDVDTALLERHGSGMDPVIMRRCRYVVEENLRVLDACTMLQRGDFTGFGQHMYMTHRGLSRDYEVSCDELDFLVQEALYSGQVTGSRMMGGGFGGCTINLIAIDRIEGFLSLITDEYRKKFDRELLTHTVVIENGTSKL